MMYQIVLRVPYTFRLDSINRTKLSSLRRDLNVRLNKRQLLNSRVGAHFNTSSHRIGATSASLGLNAQQWQHGSATAECSSNHHHAHTAHAQCVCVTRVTVCDHATQWWQETPLRGATGPELYCLKEMKDSAETWENRPRRRRSGSGMVAEVGRDRTHVNQGPHTQSERERERETCREKLRRTRWLESKNMESPGAMRIIRNSVIDASCDDILSWPHARLLVGTSWKTYGISAVYASSAARALDCFQCCCCVWNGKPRHTAAVSRTVEVFWKFVLSAMLFKYVCLFIYSTCLFTWKLSERSRGCNEWRMDVMVMATRGRGRDGTPFVHLVLVHGVQVVTRRDYIFIQRSVVLPQSVNELLYIMSVLLMNEINDDLALKIAP